MNDTNTISRNPARLLIWIALALALAYALYQAISLAWVCDDAFLSFQCARNLVDGHGLVYNVGERVEVYTNFLWTIIMAAGLLLSFDPVTMSQLLGIGSYLSVVAIFVYLSRVLVRRENRDHRIAIPLTALALLLHHDLQVFATSGLETAWATALAAAGFAIVLVGKSPRSRLWAGLVLTLAIMSRPDMAIFFIMTIPAIMLTDTQRVKNTLSYILPLVVLYLPYWLWRLTYYGFPFPNSYYAKSAALPYYSQGLIYLWLYVKTYYALFLVIPLAILAAVIILHHRKHNRVTPNEPQRGLLLGLLWAIPFVFYVVRVGGDFMFARFLIPATPILFFCMESALVAISRKTALRIITAAIIVVTVLLRWNQFGEAVVIRGIADERTAYPEEKLAQARDEAARLKKYLDGLDVRVAFSGTKAMLVYYSELPWALEGNTGLTDTVIAHRPLERRRRPGHEKRVPYEYMVEQKVNFIIGGALSRNPDPNELETISFDGAFAHIVTYQNGVMDQLRQYPEVQFVVMTDFLDRYLQQLQRIPINRLREDYAFLKRYYFDHNEDPLRQAAFTDRLNP